MKNVVRLALALAAAALVAAPALAQRPGGAQPPRGGGMGFGGGDALSLLSQKSVQEELKLTEDQIKKATETQEKFRQQRGAGGGGGGGGQFNAEEFRKRMEERRQNIEKALGEFLKPEQSKRLNQIALQQTEKTGGITAAVRDPKVAEALKLTAEQKELLTAIGEDQRKLMAEFRPGGGGGGGANFEEIQKKMADFRKSSGEKFSKTLTADQKKAWSELVGPEFKGEITRPMRRGPGGGGR
jgi:Spy/CpxP family protein refolding chaperone